MCTGTGSGMFANLPKTNSPYRPFENIAGLITPQNSLLSFGKKVKDSVKTPLGETGTPAVEPARGTNKRRSLLSQSLFSGVDSTQAVIGNPQAKATLGA
jgi:hypothetical protein